MKFNKKAIWVLVIASILFLIYWKGCNTVDAKSLIRNYRHHEKEILEAKRYVNLIVPDSFHFSIKFRSGNCVDISLSKDLGGKDSILYEWSDIQYSKENIELVRITSSLGWSVDIYDTIKDKLYRANCTAIANGKGYAYIDYKVFVPPSTCCTCLVLLRFLDKKYDVQRRFDVFSYKGV